LEFIDFIRKRLFESNIKKLSRKVIRNRVSLKFNESKTIAILFNADNQEDYELVRKYVIYLRDLKKQVKAIGYFNSNFIPHFTYPKLDYDFFCKKDLYFNLSPKTNFDKSFLEKEFDILIDLNFKNEYALRYFAILSNAKCKIGIESHTNRDIHDLLLNLEKEKGIKYFLRHLDHYLGIINQSTNLT
jgi:hypothetical protein